MKMADGLETSPSRRKLRSRRWWYVIAGISVFVGWRMATAQSRAITRARELARLAPLPASATDVHAVAFGDQFAPYAYVRFRAKPEDIEAFLIASPGLRGVTPEQFPLQRPLLSYPTVEGFDPPVTIRGRAYDVPQDEQGNWGQVIVDDVDHVVFIRANRSWGMY
jgi:hypothetical protein